MGTELEQLMTTLAALEEVDEPDIPLDVDFQEIQDLLTFVQKAGVRAALDEVGLDVATIAEATLALPAAIQAQSNWMAIRSPRKPEDQAAAEEQGRILRSAGVAALRFSLEKDRLVQASVDRIVKGGGVADLVQDLEDLATVVEQNLAGLARNRKFKAVEQVPALRAAASQIRLGLAQFRTSEAQSKAVDLRNRAWTWLDIKVSEIRGAGRYAFQGTRDAREFGSAYERRASRAYYHRRKGAKNTESGGEEAEQSG